MKTVLMILGVGLQVWPMKAEPVSAAALEQRTQSFTIVLKGSVAEVTPLFGPVREGEWSPSWAPRFIHPRKGAQHDGVVFTTVSGNGKERFWLLTTYDVKEGRVAYVILTPGFTANEVKIQVLPEGERQCKAIITYRHSALGPEGNEEVAELNEHWAEEQRIHWESAINSALAKQGAHD